MDNLESFFSDLQWRREQYGHESVRGLNLSTRARNVLRENHIYTVQELIDISDRTLMDQRNCGKGTLEEVRTRLILWLGRPETQKNGLIETYRQATVAERAAFFSWLATKR